MKTALLCLILAALALPAYAGHGTIEETDDAFIVEYTGDAADKVVDKAADKNVAKKVEPTIAAAAASQHSAAEEVRAASIKDRERREESRRRSRGPRGQRSPGDVAQEE